MFLYAKGIPAQELKLKQNALANYMTYEEAVLIDIQRNIPSLEAEKTESEKNEKENTEKEKIIRNKKKYQKREI